jgi:UDP-N-acetylmuramate: L-alanyl-gamma-D-glutamyl-meso-diaminopimelate ligase
MDLSRGLGDVYKRQVEACAGGHFVLMSNGSFGGIYQRLQKEL